MIIQEKIRDGVITNITKACPDMLNEKIIELADKILKDEAAQGVVIKTNKPKADYVDYTLRSDLTFFEPLTEVKE